MSNDVLLDIQRLDVEIGRLHHRREHLEQREALLAARSEQQRQQSEIDTLAAARVEVVTRQKRLEDEAQIVAARADQDDARLYGGEVSGMKDLQALQDEIAGLRRRQSDLEDQALEAMEEAESLAGRASTLERARADVDDRVTVLEAEIAAAEAEIDDAIAGLTSERADAAGRVDGALLDEYERLRVGLGAATVVRFDGSNCVGCPSTMPAMELDRLKHEPTGSVQHCGECGRIVVL